MATDHTSTKLGVSIVICTFNGKNRLAMTLEHLVAQTFIGSCEIILVDNASTDGTKAFADNWWYLHGGSSGISYRSYVQSKPGKSYAQELGYEQAQYSYLLICDDDNWLSNTYVQMAFEIMEARQNIGALGGWCEAVFESDKPDWFDQYARYFAVGKQANFSGDVTDSIGYLYGAGMVIRKSHWLELRKLGFEHLLSCRKGEELSSGGDTEYCYALQLLGYKIWYDERLLFKHFMTSDRLNFDYLSRLRKAMAYSNFVIQTYRLVSKGIKPSKTQELLKKTDKKLLIHGFYYFIGRYEQKEVAKTYFRGIMLLIDSHDERMEQYRFIKSWVSNKK